MPFSKTIKQKVKERAHFKCCLCRKNWVMHVHHIVPEEEGGPDSEDNAAPLCANCHDLYGANPAKRKFIRESRDFWYDICERESPSYVQQVQEMLNNVTKPLATKEDVQAAVVYLESRIQDIISQQLPPSAQARMIADTTTVFSDAIAIASDFIAISEDVVVQVTTTCPKCGASYPTPETACPFCGTPRGSESD
jgi:hypothetical protein